MRQRLLREHLDPADPFAGYPDRLAGPGLRRERLLGYLTGSLDAVLRVPHEDGPRYCVVDYKTNRLAPADEPLTAWHYRPHALVDAMVRSDYPLQLLLYAVALHRSLRWRQPGYDPDRHLGGYLARKLDRPMLLWPGICIVHQAFSETELLKLKAQHPGAPVAAHPECPPHIVDHADLVGSTKAILDFALTSPAQTILVATEPHIIHQMEKGAPHKTFIGTPGGDGNCNCNMCPYMALNTMEKLYVSLRDLEPRIEMEEGLRLSAKKSLDAMLDMAGRTVGGGDVGRPKIDGD